MCTIRVGEPQIKSRGVDLMLMKSYSGIVGPHVFSTVFGPRYRVSYGINLSILVLGITSILTSWVLIIKKDRKQSTKVER